MLIDQMELYSVDATYMPLSEEIGLQFPQAVVSHRRPLYARGRMGNFSAQLSANRGTREVHVRRSVSFKLGIWTSVAEEQDQAISLLQSTVQQLTVDNAEQQMSAIKVCLSVLLVTSEPFVCWLVLGMYLFCFLILDTMDYLFIFIM